MSVLIKDMKMPKSCKSCDLLQDYDGDMYCPLNSYLNFGDIEYVPDYVMLGCPISEAPERKKGKWMSFCRGKICNCSICHKGYDHTYEFIEEWNYCPNCGAKMER